MSTTDPLQAALGDQDPEPGAEQPDAGTPPGAAIDDHPALARFGEGPDAVRKALDAYQQLDSEYGRQGDRLGKEVAQLREQLAAIQQQPEPEPDQPYMPDMGVDELQTWMENDPVQASAYITAMGQQQTLAQVQQLLDQRLAPMEQSVGRTTARDHVEALKGALGQDMVARNAQTLVDLRRDDPEFFQGDPQRVFNRMKQAVLAAEMESNRPAQRGASQNGAATADVAVEGGSGGRNPQQLAAQDLSPEDEFIQAMDLATVERDIFGNPKRR